MPQPKEQVKKIAATSTPKQLPESVLLPLQCYQRDRHDSNSDLDEDGSPVKVLNNKYDIDTIEQNSQEISGTYDKLCVW